MRLDKEARSYFGWPLNRARAHVSMCTKQKNERIFTQCVALRDISARAMSFRAGELWKYAIVSPIRAKIDARERESIGGKQEVLLASTLRALESRLSRPPLYPSGSFSLALWLGRRLIKPHAGRLVDSRDERSTRTLKTACSLYEARSIALVAKDAHRQLMSLSWNIKLDNASWCLHFRFNPRMTQALLLFYRAIFIKKIRHVVKIATEGQKYRRLLLLTIGLT